MNKPEPKPGLIICYDYLWFDESLGGRDQGAKDRPCAIVVSPREDEHGERILLVCPVTHSPPDQGEGLKIPPKVGRAMGLDERQSWIRTTEYNEVKWSDPGIRPARKEQWAYGRMPETLYKAMRENFLENYRSHLLRRVDRTTDPDNETV